MADPQRRSDARSSPQNNPPAPAERWDDEQEQEEIVPLTRAEAERLFGPGVGRPSRVTPFRVVIAQVIVSLLAALIWWALTATAPKSHAAAVSAWLGGTMVWLPGALFALRLKVSSDRLTTSSLMIGQAIKVTVTIALLVAIAVFYPGVHWVALLTTFVLTLKAYWLAMAFR